MGSYGYFGSIFEKYPFRKILALKKQKTITVTKGKTQKITMKTPPVPTPETCDAWVSYSGINILSGNDYSAFVRERAGQGEAWATDMLGGTDAVDAFLKFWGAHMELVGKRQNGGLSKVCAQIQHAMPITREHATFTLQDCCVSSMRCRPCFEIGSVRFANESIFVHHSLLPSCQCLWAVYHTRTVLNAIVDAFQQSLQSTNLLQICQDFAACPARQEFAQFLALAARRVHGVFTEDNFFQP